nr:MAG TPA: hypothetical protein [Caudoviricetes sp.]
MSVAYCSKHSFWACKDLPCTLCSNVDTRIYMAHRSIFSGIPYHSPFVKYI